MREPNDVLRVFGERIRELRTAMGMSQEELGFVSNLDRTYISDVERGRRNISLMNIDSLARALRVDPGQLVNRVESQMPGPSASYMLREGFGVQCGFEVTGPMVLTAVGRTAEELEALPFSLFTSIDLKALSGIVGALFATHIARQSGALVNPIEKGHPDVIPLEGMNASERQLRNYGTGLEIKCTVGGVAKGSGLEPGERRLDNLSSITWQAHHRHVSSLMGLVIDFAGKRTTRGQFPLITAVFFADTLGMEDWGRISGVKGRNTKVTGMLASGKQKMGRGWVLVLDDDLLKKKYSQVLNFSLPGTSNG